MREVVKRRLCHGGGGSQKGGELWRLLKEAGVTLRGVRACVRKCGWNDGWMERTCVLCILNETGGWSLVFWYPVWPYSSHYTYTHAGERGRGAGVLGGGGGGGTRCSSPGGGADGGGGRVRDRGLRFRDRMYECVE